MISQLFFSYAKCPGRLPLGQRSPASRFSRDLILFFCRLLKIHALNQSFVSNCFGALKCAAGASRDAHHPSRSTSARWATMSRGVVKTPSATLATSRSIPVGRVAKGSITRLAFPRDLIIFFCRLLKNIPQIHSLVCTRFGALKCAAGDFREASLWDKSAAMRSPLALQNLLLIQVRQSGRLALATASSAGGARRRSNVVLRRW
jgi:hypothetical protein